MSDFFDSEAEESDTEFDPRPSASKAARSDDEDEGDGDDAEEVNDIINDEDEEAPNSDEDNIGVKRKKEDDVSSDLDEDDLDLIQENTGLKIKKKKLKRFHITMDDEEEEDSLPAKENEKDKIANELFHGADDEDDQEEVSNAPPQMESVGFDLSSEEGDEESDVDDFIVDANDRPVSKGNKKSGIDGATSSALLEAQDIFGLGFDFDEFEDMEEDLEEEEDFEDDEDGVSSHKKKKKRRSHKPGTTIQDIYEPSELERNFLTERDNEIRLLDIPERFQLRSVPVRATEDDSELIEEASWIYKQAFQKRGILAQTGRDKSSLPANIVLKIKAVLDLIRNQLLEVPFIARYRKDRILPELDTEDLWKIYDWDERWMQFELRRQGLVRLMGKIQAYQFERARGSDVVGDVRVLDDEDIQRTKEADSFEVLQDIQLHFQLHYSEEVRRMTDAAHKSQAGSDGALSPQTSEGLTVSQRKLPKRSDLYTLCKQNNLQKFVHMVGLSAQNFASNLLHQYTRHQPERCAVKPSEAASEFVCSLFPTEKAVEDAGYRMLALEISREPQMRQLVRADYYRRVKLSIQPTKKGIKEVDDNHPYAAFKYLKAKPLSEIPPTDYLKMHQGQEDGLLTLTFHIDDENSESYIKEHSSLFVVEEYQRVVQEWNKLRLQAFREAITAILFPCFEKEIRAAALKEAWNSLIQQCASRYRALIDVAPCTHSHDDTEESEESNMTPVMAINFDENPSIAAFAVMLGTAGETVEVLKLRNMVKRLHSPYESERIDKARDLEILKNFISKHEPPFIAVAACCRLAQNIAEDVRSCLKDLKLLESTRVELVEAEVAKVYQNSPRSGNEYREYPRELHLAVSIGRLVQDPLVEIAQMFEEEGEVFCLRLHPLQNLAQKELLYKALEREMISMVNLVGVDANLALSQPRRSVLLQFICGLGPRKAAGLVKAIKQRGGVLVSRPSLITVHGMGPKVFMNCAGFLKIKSTDMSSEVADSACRFFDSTRIHPEHYDWASRMSIDAYVLGADEPVDEDRQDEAIAEILEDPDRLRQLDLDHYAVELCRQGFGDTTHLLNDIKDELTRRFVDPRKPYQSPVAERLLTMLTGESEDTVGYGKLVTCTVTGFAHRALTRDQIQHTNPDRVEETNMWRCPFCYRSNFMDLSETLGHFEDGCPGETIGVRTRLESGITGFIGNRNISDKQVTCPQDRVKVGMIITCRVVKLNMERFQVELSCRSSDLANTHGKFMTHMDPYYDHSSAEKDKSVAAGLKNDAAKRTLYLKRVIAHPSFRNVTSKEAEKLLESMEVGECIIRPSSKGSDHLSLTLKTGDGIFLHIDVQEQSKSNAFSLGKSLKIGDEVFEDLDEVLARFVQPLMANFREVTNHRCYKDGCGGSLQKLEEYLQAEKQRTTNRIPYAMMLCRQHPGKVYLACLPRTSTFSELVTVSPSGFRYRNKLFPTISALLKWYKEHFRDHLPSRSISTEPSAQPTPMTIPMQPIYPGMAMQPQPMGVQLSAAMHPGVPAVAAGAAAHADPYGIWPAAYQSYPPMQAPGYYPFGQYLAPPQ